MVLFILSRGTSSKILKHIKSTSKSLQIEVPVDFNSKKQKFQIENKIVLFQQQSRDFESKKSKSLSFQIPEEVFRECFKRNLAYSVSLIPSETYQVKKESIEETTVQEWIPPSLTSPVQVFGSDNKENTLALFEPLALRAKDGKVFKLTEPNQERDIIGSILEMEGMKMHVTQGMDNTFEFSQLLANSSGVQKSHIVLDMFLGLGYSAKECIKKGAKKVVTFEKYPEVIELVKKNPFSIDLSSPQLHLIEPCLDLLTEQKRFFQELKQLSLHFDSVIIDPPRRKVMLEIYSKEFLLQLAQFIKKGALVSVYSPQGTMKNFRQSMEKIDSIFEETGCFKYLSQSSKSSDIKIFQKVK